MANNFEDLKIWQMGESLAMRIYSLTDKFPKHELYNIVSQLRRAAISVPTNIAEASGRYHDKESIHFMFNARGSAEEVRSLLMSSRDLSYVKQNTFASLNEEYLGLIRGINGFIRSLRKTN